MGEPSEVVDGEVLRLRSAGRSFARISRELQLQRPADAQRAFQRAFHRLPLVEQDLVRQRELLRLDNLAERVSTDTDTPEVDRTRRLAAVERLRGLLAPEPS